MQKNHQLIVFIPVASLHLILSYSIIILVSSLVAVVIFKLFFQQIVVTFLGKSNNV